MNNMKIIKNALAAVLSVSMLLSSSNALALESEADNTRQDVEVNTMWRFMWPRGYNITKIKTEGCSISCLKTYVVKDGYLSLFVPDNNAEDQVSIFAYTDDNVVIEVDINVIKACESTCTEPVSDTEITEMTTGCSVSDTEMTKVTTGCSVSNTETTKITTGRSVSDTTRAGSVYTTTDKSSSDGQHTGGYPQGDSYSNTSGSAGTEITASKDDPMSPSENAAPTGGGSRSWSDKDDERTSFGTVIDPNTIENVAVKSDFIMLGGFYPGDMNLDGSVDLTDLTILSVTVLTHRKYNDERQMNADVDGNDIVDIADLARLRQVVSKEEGITLSVSETGKIIYVRL